MQLSRGIAFAALMLSFGCPDEDDETLPDAATDTGVRDTGTPDSGVEDTGVEDTGTGDTGVLPSYPCNSGVTSPVPTGVGGGALAGRLTVFMVDENGDPLSGVTVIAESGGETFTSSTGADGCLEFEDAAISGSANVHWVPDGAAVSGGTWANLTTAAIAVQIFPPNFNPPPMGGTVEGVIENLDVLGSTTATTAQIAFVDQMAPNPFTQLPMQAVRPGTQIGTNTAIVGGPGFAFTDYRARVLVGARHVAALGGIVDFSAPQPATELSHIGYLELAPPIDTGEVRSAQNISLTHPLTETLTLQYGDTRGLTQFVALGMVVMMPERDGWLFPFFANMASPNNTITIEDMPELTGPFANASYAVGIQVTDAQNTTFSLILDVDPTIMPGDTVDLGDMPAPPANIAVESREITAMIEPGTNFVEIFVVRGQRIAWQATMFNPQAPLSIQLPTLPIEVTDPIGTGAAMVYVITYQLDALDPDDLSFSEYDVTAFIRRFAQSQQSVSF